MNLPVSHFERSKLIDFDGSFPFKFTVDGNDNDLRMKIAMCGNIHGQWTFRVMRLHLIDFEKTDQGVPPGTLQVYGSCGPKRTTFFFESATDMAYARLLS